MPFQTDDKLTCEPGTCPVCDSLRTWVQAGLEEGASPGAILQVMISILAEETSDGRAIH